MTAARRLEGRRALITGAGSGIGLATAVRLASEGAAVAVVDARAEGVAAASEAVLGVGGQVVGALADVGDEAQVRDAVALAVSTFGGLDALVTCAGIARNEATHELALEKWEMVLRINLTGTFLSIKHSLPALMESGSASIVTIGSVASLVAAGSDPSYDASKGGVLQLTRSVAAEYVDRGIRANCVCPGVIATGLRANSNQLAGGQSEANRPPSPALRQRPPMERRADPSEVASVVAFLLSDDASFMTGAAVPVDGGYTSI